MADDEKPPTEPRNALVPPSRRPPTAIGTGTPEPPRPPRRPRHVHRERQVRLFPALGRVVTRVLDALDTVGEAIAVNLGLRPGKRGSAGPPPAAP